MTSLGRRRPASMRRSAAAPFLPLPSAVSTGCCWLPLHSPVFPRRGRCPVPGVRCYHPGVRRWAVPSATGDPDLPRAGYLALAKPAVVQAALAVQAEQDAQTEPAQVPSAAERLREVSELHDAGLLTDAEYAAKRVALRRLVAHRRLGGVPRVLGPGPVRLARLPRPAIGTDQKTLLMWWNSRRQSPAAGLPPRRRPPVARPRSRRGSLRPGLARRVCRPAGRLRGRADPGDWQYVDLVVAGTGIGEGTPWS